MSHGNNNARADIIANRKWEREVRREAAERKRKRDEYLRKMDEEYARAFPKNLKHGTYKVVSL